MPKGQVGRNAGADLPALVSPRLMKGLEHVLRQHILLMMVEGEASPKELAELLDQDLSSVSYHVRVLRDECGLIEESRRERRRGTVEHYYRVSAKTLLPAKIWRGLKKGMRTVVGSGLASDLFDDLAGALKAGKLQGRNDYVGRTPLVLDEEGRRNVQAIARRATREAEGEQAEASERIAARNGGGSGVAGYSFGVLAFEAAWDVADRSAPAAGGERADSAAKPPAANRTAAAKKPG